METAKLNIANMVPDDLDEVDLAKYPWGALIYDDSCAISSYGAHACLKELATNWNDDYGQNRQYVLSTLDRAIQHLQRWRDAFRDLTYAEDTRREQHRLLGQYLRDELPLADIVDAGQQIAAAAKTAAQWNPLTEALIASAFADPE